jgi:PAS domain S-box-containing protein
MDLDQIGRDVLESMIAPLYIRDREKRLLYMNPAAERVTGWSASEALGRYCYEVFGDKYVRCRESCAAEEVIAQGAPLSQQVGRLLRRSGEVITVGTSISPLYEEGEIRGAIIVFEDVTTLDKTLVSLRKEIRERRQVEADLKRSEERYRNLFNNAQIGLFRATVEDGITLEINRKGAEILGYGSPEECVDKYIAADHYVDRGAREHMVKALRARGFIDNFEAQLRRRDGSLFWGRTSCRIYSERDYIEGIFADVTQEKESAKTLQESHQRLLAVLDGIDASIFVADLETYELLFVNRHMTRTYREDLIGKPCYQALFGRSSPCGDCKAQDLLDAEGEPNEGVVWEGPSPKTGLWRRRYDKAIRWLDGRLVRLRLGVNIDDQKKAQEEMAKLEAQLRHSQKMQAIGTLAGGVAHDFNNLLAVILGNAEFMLLDLKADDPVHGRAVQIKNAAERAAALTRQLLTFSRRQIIEPKVLQLDDTLLGIEKMLGRLLGEDINLQIVSGADLWTVKIDPGQIEQVIMNLAVNARDAMPTGGTLAFETENTNLDEAYFHEKAVSGLPGPYVRLAVRDTGAGMDEETLSRAFEPFFSTKERGRGTGLGLSIVYGIVKQNKGYIWAHSKVSRGTTIEILLPRTEEEAVREEEGHAAGPVRGSETVLLVEDDELVREMTRSALERCGFAVLDAGGGEEALRLAREYEGRIDLLLTDVVMPGMSGGDLAQRIGSLALDLKVLFMSGFTDRAIGDYGVLPSEMNYIQKPFSPQALAREVRRILDGK